VRGKFCVMKYAKTILGGILAICVGAAAVADTGVRPVSRNDVVTSKAEAATVLLAGFRVRGRPDYMIRYPAIVSNVAPSVRPLARSAYLPNTRWDHKDGSDLWTRAAMTAIAGHGDGLESLVPRDVDQWCPAYTENGPEKRRAFWVGMMSALAKHESTYNPGAVGGGDLWFGLLQIYPDTARRYGCFARTGEALKDPEDNLSCAARIMNVTVARDNAIAVRDSRWRGIAADWGPMSNQGKRAEMVAWTNRQSYCQPQTNKRPEARPARGWDVTLSTMNVPSGR
jgi:hypothetical protein